MHSEDDMGGISCSVPLASLNALLAYLLPSALEIHHVVTSGSVYNPRHGRPQGCVRAVMNFFDFSISEHLHGRWCRFIIHRYLGHLLEKNLALEQLSIDLTRGCVKVDQVNLNVQYINDILTGLNVPLKLIDGFIGHIRIEVPWMQLMADATQVALKDVQITFHAKDAFKVEDRDLVTSMIGSVVESLVSSMDLAQSFVQEEQKEGEIDENQDSVHAFAKVIDAIVSRFCCKIEQLTIRIESASPNSDMSTALELHMDDVEFMDEQMKVCKQEGKSAETIRSQPHGLSNITNLTKVLTLRGLSLYTDTFSKTDVAYPLNSACSNVTSMYLRREHNKKQRELGASLTSMYQSARMNQSYMSEIYQSCYNSIQNNESLREHFDTSVQDMRPDIKICSNPVKFAEASDDVRVVLRLRNTDIEAHNADNKVEIEVFCDSLNVIVSPSQLFIAKKFLAALLCAEDKTKKNVNIGKPMENNDFDVVQRQLDNITDDNDMPSTNLLGRTGNWRGADDFKGFSSISLGADDRHGSKIDSRPAQVSVQKDQSGGRKETAIISLKIGTMLMYLTHEDPLSTDAVGTYAKGAFDAIDTLHEQSEHFFKNAPRLKFYKSTPLASLHEAADKLYQKDHLRFVGSTVAINYIVESAPRSQRSVTKMLVSNLDCVEYLGPDSNAAGDEPLHLPILKFEREEGDIEPQFTLTVKSEDKKTSTELHLSKCSSELDMSMSDRVSELLNTRPFFLTKVIKEEKCALPALNEDLFAEISRDQEIPNNMVEIHCSSWTVDLRIPKVDLRDDVIVRMPHTQRHVHNELLRLRLGDVRVAIPPQERDGPKTVDINCLKVSGQFVGDLAELGCTEEESHFFHASGTNMKHVNIRFEYDGRNKSLKKSVLHLHPSDDMTKSISADYLKNVPIIDGPFSQTHQSFSQSNAAHNAEDNIVNAGSREEMESFSIDCLEQSDICLKFELPILRLLIPNQKFLELLYNRLANDLALWQNNSPAIKMKNMPPIEECFKECKVVGMRSIGVAESSDEDVEDESGAKPKDKINRNKSHFFSLLLDIGKGTMVIGTETKLPNQPTAPPKQSQLSSTLGAAQMFLVYGYHGDLAQTYFYLTTSELSVAQRNGAPSIPKNVFSKDFGAHQKNELQLQSLAKTSPYVKDPRADCLAVALHLSQRKDMNVKDSTLAIALRQLDLNVVPLKNIEDWWICQFKEVFLTLTDYEIPGYEIPQVSTELHVNLDHIVLSYDHCNVKPDSKLKLKCVLGNVDISSMIVPLTSVSKFLCIFEDAHLYMGNSDTENDGPPKKLTFAGEESLTVVKNVNELVHVMQIGLFQLEILASTEPEAKGSRKFPLTEIKCKNDTVKVWVCHDSLVAVINIITDIMTCDALKEEDDEPGAWPTTSVSTMEQVSGHIHPSLQSTTTESTHTRSTVKQTVTTTLPPHMQKMLESAMEETDSAVSPPKKEPETNGIELGEEPADIFADHPTYSRNQQREFDEESMDGSDGVPEVNADARSNTFSTDEEFYMVEDFIGSGITSATGEPRVRYIGSNKAKDGLSIDITHFAVPSDLRSDCLNLPSEFSVPLYRYIIKDISVSLHIFSGNDLGDQPDPEKSYSVQEYCDGTGKGQRVANEAKGGPHRDHSVSIAIELSKISYVFQTFDRDAPMAAMKFISIQDITVKDNLTASNIKEALYQYSTAEQPRRTCAPMLAIRIVENHQQEGKLGISILPVRLNIDQDTMEFIEEFIQNVATSLSLPAGAINLQPRPILEVPVNSPPTDKTFSVASTSRMDSLHPSSVPLQPTPSPTSPKDPGFNPQKFSNLRDLDEPGELGDLFKLSTEPVEEPMASPSQNGAQTVDDLLGDFSEKPVPPPRRAQSNTRSTIFDVQHDEEEGGLHDLSGDWANNSQIRFSSQSNYPEMTVDDLLARSSMEGSFHPDLFFGSKQETPQEMETSEHETICSEAPRRTSVPDPAAIRGQIFFKEFTFSPPCSIYIDYHGKNKYNMERTGALIGVLKGVTQLNRTELPLKEINHKNGLLGIGRCLTFAIDEWSEDVMTNIPGVLATCGPISPIVQIGKGICDLVWMPMAELRKEDGHVVKGIQRGAGSFGISTAAAVVDLAQRVIGAVQVAAEAVLYEVTPDQPHLNNRNRRPITDRMTAPPDIRHGVQLAYDIIADGVQQTREDLELATQEDRASGRSSFRSVMRYATPTILRPFVITSQISYHLLGGLKNQLRPDQFHEEQHKWKDNK